MWESRFEKLNATEKEEFKRYVNMLLGKTFIVRDLYDREENRMKIHKNYRFIERNWELFVDYLSFGGWTLHKDNHYGVIHLESSYGYNHKNFNKFTTCLLLTLRLIFEEKREEISLRNDVVVTVSAVIQKMLTIGVVDKKPANRDMVEGFKMLSRFSIIEKTSGKWEHPDTFFLILPAILFILPNENISELASLLTGDELDETEDRDGEEE